MKEVEEGVWSVYVGKEKDSNENYMISFSNEKYSKVCPFHSEKWKVANGNVFRLQILKYEN